MRTHSSLHCYGGPFGLEHEQTSLPTCMHRMHRNYAWNSRSVAGSAVCNRASACSVEARNGACVAKVDGVGNVVSGSEAHTERYTYMDEIFMNSQQQHMLWSRDNGVIELMPIAVVYQSESDVF
jgi:hypothetical protein